MKSYIVQDAARSLALNRNYLKRFGQESIGAEEENVHIKSCEEKEARNFGLTTKPIIKTREEGKVMTKQEFISWAKSRGWKEDKFGHLQKKVGNTSYRFKLSSTAVRFEKQITFSDGKHEWLRLDSGYYKKDLSVNSEGKLSGIMRR